MLKFDLSPELMGAIGEKLNQGKRIEAIKVLRLSTKDNDFAPSLYASKEIIHAIENGAWQWIYGGGDPDIVRYRVTL